MKLRKLAKKLLSVLLVFALSVNLTLSTFAAASDDSDGLKPLSEITVEELETAALNVAAMFAPDEEVDVGEIIPMYDASDTLIGFSVSYTQEEESCGYVILDFRNEFPVADVCIGAEVTSPYYTCETTTATEVSMDVPLEPTLETEKRIYSVGSAQYSSNAEDAASLMQCRMEGNGVEDDEGEGSETVYDEHNDIFIEGTNIASGNLYSKYTSKYNASKSIITETEIKTATGCYACAVVALTEIASQEGIMYSGSTWSKKLANTFNLIWDYTETHVYDTNDSGIQLGTTSDSKLASGMKKYVEKVGHTISTSSTSNPSFAYLQVVADNDISGTFSYRIYVSSSNSSGYSKIGHTVNLVGYIVVKYGKDTYNYLCVIDGWDTEKIRFIDYDNTDFVSTYAVRYTIS